MNDEKELIIIDKVPPIPKRWDYAESVRRFVNLSRDVRKYGAAALVEVRNAHFHLYHDSHKKTGRRWPTKTFKTYCEAIGYHHTTAVRWLQRYFTDYYDEFQQRRVADATVPLENADSRGVTALNRRPPRGYIKPMDDYVLDRGRDPFLRPKRDPELPKIRRRLEFLFNKYLTYRQALFARLHFFNGKTPEEISAYYSKDAGGEPLTADGVYRALKRIRWLIVRRYAYLCGYKLHKRLGTILSDKERRVLAGWIEAEKYVWRGAGRD